MYLSEYNNLFPAPLPGTSALVPPHKRLTGCPTVHGAWDAKEGGKLLRETPGTTLFGAAICWKPIPRHRVFAHAPNRLKVHINETSLYRDTYQG